MTWKDKKPFKRRNFVTDEKVFTVHWGPRSCKGRKHYLFLKMLGAKLCINSSLNDSTCMIWQKGSIFPKSQRISQPWVQCVYRWWRIRRREGDPNVWTMNKQDKKATTKWSNFYVWRHPSSVATQYPSSSTSRSINLQNTHWMKWTPPSKSDRHFFLCNFTTKSIQYLLATFLSC